MITRPPECQTFWRRQGYMDGINLVLLIGRGLVVNTK